MLNIIILLVSAYLLGSIPTAVWVGKIFFGLDVREHGSGNAGATNTIRVLGYKAGIPVMIIDVLKGWAAAKLVFLNTLFAADTNAFITLQLGLGLLAVLGHIFPVFARFRGGKGVATLFGAALAILPWSTLICVAVFFITLLISRYVSLSSMLAGISFPLVVIFLFHTTVISLIIFSILTAILLLLTHQRNIERLLKNEESKAEFLGLWKKRQS